MILDNAAYPPLPALAPDTTTSFHPYPLHARSALHATLHPVQPRQPPITLRGVPPLASSSSSSSTSSRSPMAGLGSDPSKVKAERRSLRRAERRAIMGKRPAGTGLGREADELSDEEEALMQDKDQTNMFGHRFLLPIGRRQTQMEMDNAPSPTPSDADRDRRQEDQGLVSPVHAHGEEDEPGGELDLDASIEDLDADVEDLDASMEGQSAAELEQHDEE